MGIMLSGLVLGGFPSPPSVRSQDDPRPIITADNIAQLAQTNTLDLNSPGWINNLAFTPDGTQLAVSYDTDSDITFALWDVAESRIAFSLTDRFVRGLSFDPTGTRLAITSLSKELEAEDVAGIVEILSVDDLSVQATFDEHVALDVAFDLSGSGVVTNTIDSRLILWDWQQDKVVAEFSAGEGYIYGTAAFSPTGDLLAAGTYSIESAPTGNIFVWDVARGDLLYTLEGHINEVLHVEFISDDLLISSSDDGSTFIWDIHNSTPLVELAGRNFSYSPNGKILATTTNDAIQFWNMRDPAAPIELRRLELPTGWFNYHLAFNPGGTLLAIDIENDKSAPVQLWAVEPD